MKPEATVTQPTDRTGQTDDQRIKDITVLPPPEHLIRFFPIHGTAIETLIGDTRHRIHDIMAGSDDRLLVVIGPCSIHDPAAALEYARRLLAQRHHYADTLEIVMRVYFEKPRTTVGWKGLINDPYLDETFRIDEGLRIARQLLIDINRLGLPAGVTKCRDTLDVWIDSGCSHVAVLEKNPQLHAPADLYLEATDQHRGWFQSSLMMSVAWRGVAPYKAVLTHGFVVDKDKKKISKSDAAKAGKPTDAAFFYNKYGADILRLWVSSVDWQSEVPFSEDLFKQVAEPYRRLRNTLRILLGNLDGFDPEMDRVAPSHLPLLDQWILERLHAVVTECRKAYEQYEFRKVFNAVNQFCATDLSAIYVDATKDRMYCDARNSVRRRASQTAGMIKARPANMPGIMPAANSAGTDAPGTSTL